MVFVKPAVRKSLLAKMLGEILDTRVMVKQGMKGAKGNKVGSFRFSQGIS
jgi:DNA polymerase zeta